MKFILIAFLTLMPQSNILKYVMDDSHQSSHFFESLFGTNDRNRCDMKAGIYSFEM